ncbi:PDZ domain-containing protein 7-like isoform X3 [Ptychodera flava]|uniref:PDZ domain-containing protein 7-like isoform X3 n=1 Tax=Ptychodera flava TaxID=63121 RepID=UPI00396A22AB
MSFRRVDSQRKFYLRQFHERSRLVLSDLERSYLHDVLREYHSYKDVASLMIALMNCLDTPRKLDLLREIRNIIPPVDVMEFDRLAPYHRMAHPYDQHASFRGITNRAAYSPRPAQPPSPSQPRQQRATTPTPSQKSVMTVHRLIPQKEPQHRKPAHHESMSSRQDDLSVTYPGANHNGYTQEGTLHLVTINKEDDSLGFSIRGGSEHGLGIFVSQIDDGSVADRNGLEIGDQILEVNSVSFDNVATSSAVMVLQGSSRLRMIVKRTGKVPGFKFAKEKTSWYDTLKRTVVKEHRVDENEAPNTNRSEMHILSGTNERRVTLHTGDNQVLGLNIRGGSEYGLGIYVSRVDRGGPAEASGIRVGDLLLDVNGKSFENITHGEAVDFLRRQRHLIMTIKDVNKFPAYKEMIAEYSWTDGEPRRIKVLRPSTAPPTVNHTWQNKNGPSDPIPDDIVDRYAQMLDEESQITSEVAETNLHAAPRTTESQTYAVDPPGESPAERSQTKKSSIGILTVLKGNKSPMSRSHSLNIKYNPDDLEAKQFYNDEKRGKKVKRSRSIKEIFFRSRSKDKSEKSKNGSQGTAATKPKTRLGLGSFMTSKHSSKSSPREEAVSPETVFTTQTVTTTYAAPPPSNGEDRDFEVHTVPTIVVREPNGEARSVEPETKVVKQDSSAFQDTYGSIGKKRGVFIHGAGTQIMLQQTSRQHSLPAIESAARKYVDNEDEVNAIIRHVKRYMAEGDVEMLVRPLLAILDKPKKVVVLKEIRPVIMPTDIGRFDSMVSRTEVEAYDELQVSTVFWKFNHVKGKTIEQVYETEDPSTLEDEQLLQKTSEGLPKKTLLATKPGMKGDFTLKSQEQYEKERRRKEELERLKRERQEEVKKQKETVAEVQVQSLAYSHVPVIGPPQTKRDSPEPVSSTPKASPEVVRITKETEGSEGEENSGIVLIKVTEQSDYAEISPVKQETEVHVSANQVTESAVGQVIESKVAVKQIQLDVPSEDSDSDEDVDSDVDSSDSNGSRSGIYHINAQDDESDNDSEIVADELALTTGDNHDLIVTSVSSTRSNTSSPISPVSLTNESSMSINLPSSAYSSANHSPAPTSPPAEDTTDGVSALYATVDFSKKKPKSTSPKVISKTVHISESSPPPTPPRNVRGILKNKDEVSLSYKEPSPLKEAMATADVKLVSHSPTEDTTPETPEVYTEVTHSTSETVENQTTYTTTKTIVVETSNTTSETLEVERANPATDTVVTETANPTPDSVVVETVETIYEVPAPPSPPPPPPPPPPPQEVTIELKKTKSSLGMSISGGRDSKTQPTVKIERIFAGGSASDNGKLKAGYEIISIEGTSLKGASHPEAVDIIRRAYQNKKKNTMTMVVLPTS